MKAGPVRIPGAYSLEGYLHPSSKPEIARCVICHPHPQFGGSMDNNVVYALADLLPEFGISTLRFNFRGVGKSEGTFGNVTGEAQDLNAALDWLRRGFDGKMWVAAYSFGATVASFLIAENPTVCDAVALISPPVAFPGLEPKFSKTPPCFVICGDRDEFCPQEQLISQLTDFPAPKIIKGADHFWSRGLAQMAESVGDFFLPFVQER